MSTFSNFRIWLVTSDKAGNLLANGKVVVAGTIQCNFKIMKSDKGIFAAFPSEMVMKGEEKTYYPIMNLLDDTTKKQFQEAAMEAYNEVVTQANTTPQTQEPKKKALPF